MFPHFAALLFVALQSTTAPTPARRVELAAPPGAHEPQLAVGTDGTVVVAYGVGHAIHVQVSKDHGATFGPTIRVGEHGKLALGLRRGPRVARHGNALTITAIHGKDLAGKDGDLFAWTSSDLGATWSAPVRVNAADSGAAEGLQTLACSDEGALLCAWVDLLDPKPVVRASRSTDGGRSWGENVNVMKPENELCPCCCPTATFGPNGVVHVMWRGVESGNRDAWYTSGTMKTKTFLPPRRLASDRWQTDQCPMDLGSLLVTDLGQTAIVRRGDHIVSVGGPSLATAKAETVLGSGRDAWAARGARHEYVIYCEQAGGPLVLVGGDEPRRVLAKSASAAVLAAPPLGADPVIAAWEEGTWAESKLIVERVDGATSKR